MRDTVWQYMPFDPYDIESIEAWLAGLCEKGLVPERVTRAFVRCRRESGEECRVRAIPAAHTREEEPPEAQRELFEAAGWTYIGTFGRFLHIFRTLDPAASEPDTDRALYAETLNRRVVGRSLRSFVFSTLLLIASAGFIVFVTLQSKTPLLSLLSSGLWRIAFLSVLTVLALYFAVQQLVKALSLRHRLARGEPMPRARRFSAAGMTARRIGEALLVCLLIAYFVILLASVGFRKTYAVSEAPLLPFPTLTALSPDAEPGGLPADGTDLADHVDIRRDLFVSPCYALRQREFAQDRDMPRTLYADVYFCRIPALNRRIALELADDKPSDAEILWQDGEFYILRYEGKTPYIEEKAQILVFCTPDRAGRVVYAGEADLSAFAFKFAGLAQ